MSPDPFDHLAQLLQPVIQKQNTHFRQPICVKDRLAVTLRYLVSGDSLQSLGWAHRIGKTTISQIIKETTNTIWELLKEVSLKPTQEVADWKAISEEIENLWNFPHCIGAIDGKYAATECPKLSETQYFNYKGFFSVVLLAICDAKYCFTYVNFGKYGCTNDSSFLRSSGLYKAFEENKFNVPAPMKADGFEDPLPYFPYFLHGDEIFSLNIWLMRSFPGSLDDSQKIFNYRLSKCIWHFGSKMVDF